MEEHPRFVLMTSAKDEGQFVGLTLDSIADQSCKPLRHIIVDDGSSDNTAEVVERRAVNNPSIQLLRGKKGVARTFGSKVAALTAAYEAVRSLQFDYIGCVDADITFPTDYYERLMEKMERDPKLGLASGLCLQKKGDDWIKIMTNSQHVPGALQFFKRRCYEEIGGYQRVTIAGVDSLAEIKARMRGWTTRSFVDLHAFHHKPIGSATGGRMKTSYRRGMTDYLLGKHPLYVLAKGFRRLAAPPYGLDAIAHLCGYSSLLVKKHPLDVTEEVKNYVRTEEMDMIRNALIHGKRPY